MARDLRRGQRLLPAGAREHPVTGTPERNHPARHAARRGDHVGVHVPLRRRRPAVDERAHPGHRTAGLLTRVVAPEDAHLPDRRPAGAEALPGTPTGRRPCRHGRRRDLPGVHLRPPGAHHQRLHPVAQRALRLRQADRRPRRAQALRRRRRRGPPGGAPLQHRRLVDVRPALRIGPQLPRAADRIPAGPLHAHRGRRAAARHRAARTCRHQTHHHRRLPLPRLPPPRLPLPRPPAPRPRRPARPPRRPPHPRRQRPASSAPEPLRRRPRSRGTRSTARPPSSSPRTCTRRPRSRS